MNEVVQYQLLPLLPRNVYLTCDNVSRWTIWRRVKEFGIEGETAYCSLPDSELDAIVQQFMSQHGTLVGCSIVSGHLRSIGLRIQ